MHPSRFQGEILHTRVILLFTRTPFMSFFFLTLRQMDPSVIYGDKDPMSPPFETPSGALRERYGNGDGGADRPAWWGKPLAVAGGFADYRS